MKIYRFAKRHRRFLLYAAALAAALVRFSFQGGLLPYAAVYTLLLVPLAAAAYLFYACHAFQFYQGLSVHLMTKSESVLFPLVLENAGPFPIVSLRLHLEKERCLVRQFDDGAVLSLEPGERLEFSPEIVCLYAGAYDIGAVCYTVRDCFGLFSFTGRIHTPFRAIVRPQITDRADALLDLDHLRNAIELNNPYLTETTLGAELREYRPGDRLHQIHWKNTARTGQMLVRKPEPRQMEQIRVLLLPERAADSLEDARRRDLFLELAVSIADYFCRQNQSVLFYYPKTDMQEAAVDSYDSFQRFYERLPEELSAACKDDMDWAAWLNSHDAGLGGMVLLLHENCENQNPLTIYGA